MKALVVTGNVDIERAISEALASRRWDFVSVRGASAALRAFEDDPCPIVIVDLALPEGSALDFCRRLRSSSAGQGLVILAFSSTDLPENLEPILEAGVDDFLSRPQSAQWLRARLILADRKWRDLQVRRRSNDALRSSLEKIELIQTRHQAVLRSTPNGLCMLDRYWMIEWCNAAITRIMSPQGGPAQDLRGQSFQVFFSSGEEFQRYRRAAELLLRSSGADVQQRALRRQDGGLFYGEITMAPAGDGRIDSGYVATLTDVTERKRAEEALQGRIEFEQLISGISSNFIHLDPEDLAEGVNGALQEIAEFVGADRSRVFLFSRDGSSASLAFEWHSGGADTDVPAVEDLCATRHSWAMARFLNQDVISFSRLEDLPAEAAAEREWFRARAVRSAVAAPIVCGKSRLGFIDFETVARETVWTDDEVGLLRIVSEFFGNAIERARAEEKRKRHVQETQCLAALSRSFVGRSPRASLQVLNEDIGNGLYGNADVGFLRLSSQTGEVYVLAASHAKAIQTWEDYTRQSEPRALAERPFIQMAIERREPVLCDDYMKDSRFVSLWDDMRARGLRSRLIVPVLNKGEVLGVLAASLTGQGCFWKEDVAFFQQVADIVGIGMAQVLAEEERSRIEQQMQQTQKLESLGVLAGGIAHDFNNLLMGIMGNAGLALMDLGSDSPARHSVLNIEGAAMRAADLTRQMLAYSGQGQFVIHPLDLSSLVEEMTHLLEVSISKKALLKCEFARGLPAVEADPAQVRQVVMNLITNASESLAEENGQIVIQTGMMTAAPEFFSKARLGENLPEGRYVFVRVSDTGCGMDTATLERIFDPFYSTKFTGRGLGLAAVLGIVRSHKGAVRVDSAPGGGSTFTVLFPPSNRPAQSIATPKAHRGKAWRGSGLVLVVDDEEGVRQVVARILQGHGFDVVLAKDGGEGVETFQRDASKIRLVLLDLTMPRLDGLQAFRAIRGIDPEARVLLSSGYNEREVTARFGDEGLAGFIQKPFLPAALMEKIRQILEEKSAAV